MAEVLERHYYILKLLFSLESSIGKPQAVSLYHNSSVWFFLNVIFNGYQYLIGCTVFYLFLKQYIYSFLSIYCLINNEASTEIRVFTKNSM